LQQFIEELCNPGTRAKQVASRGNSGISANKKLKVYQILRNFIQENSFFVLLASAQSDYSGLCGDFLQVRKQVGEDLVVVILAPVVLDATQEILVTHHMHKVGMQCYAKLF
jgi:UTP-glucose-1-phosphate uridylyltransferase